MNGEAQIKKARELVGRGKLSLVCLTNTFQSPKLATKLGLAASLFSSAKVCLSYNASGGSNIRFTMIVNAMDDPRRLM